MAPSAQHDGAHDFDFLIGGDGVNRRLIMNTQFKLFLGGTFQANSGTAIYFGSGTFANNNPSFQGPGLLGITNGTPTMTDFLPGVIARASVA